MLAKAFDVLGFAPYATDAFARPWQVGNSLEGPREQALAFSRGNRGDAHQAGHAVGATRERRGVDSRCHGVHAVPGKPVVLDQTARGPFGSRHDRARSLQGFPLQRVEFGRERGRQAGLVGQRQVDQHGDGKPPGGRDDHFGHPAGDQAVDQHGRARGQRAEQPGQHRAGFRIGARPVAADGDLVHLLALRGQVVAEPAVVDVAAAWRCHVVDVTGQHHVESVHSARS